MQVTVTFHRRLKCVTYTSNNSKKRSCKTQISISWNNCPAFETDYSFQYHFPLGAISESTLRNRTQCECLLIVYVLPQIIHQRNLYSIMYPSSGKSEKNPRARAHSQQSSFAVISRPASILCRKWRPTSAVNEESTSPRQPTEKRITPIIDNQTKLY